MFKKILFPTRFEEFSMETLKSVCCLQAGGLEEVILLHVIRTGGLYESAGWGIVYNLKAIEQEANKRFSAYTEYLTAQGIKSKSLVCTGRLVSETIRVATEEHASLIVAGRQKRGILGELFVGTMTHGLIRKSPLPILVTKYHTFKETGGEIRESFCTDMFGKILFATDWSDCAQRAKDHLKLLRQVGASEVILVHVNGQEFYETEYVTDELRGQWTKEIDQRVAAIEEELSGLGYKVSLVLREGGSPYRHIVELASENDVSLILMGSHGRGFVSETLFWGSVSQRVAQYSEKPVLIVK